MMPVSLAASPAGAMDTARPIMEIAGSCGRRLGCVEAAPPAVTFTPAATLTVRVHVTAPAVSVHSSDDGPGRSDIGLPVLSVDGYRVHSVKHWAQICQD